MDLICRTTKKSRVSDSVARIPEEIFIEILSRLPVKDLLRFKCVCKSWKSLISDAYFMRKHLVCMSSSKCNPSYRHLLFADKNFTRLESIPLDYILGLKDCESTANPTRTILRLDEIPSNNLRPLYSCNGMILLLDHDKGTLFLWNPSIRESKKLPDGGLHRRYRMNNHFGFGYDSQSNDYKVVEVSKKRASLYSLRTNSWRRLADLPYRWVCCYASCGNALIWRIDPFKREGWKRFLSFDLVKESFQEHPLPEHKDTKRKNFRLGELHGDVCAMYMLSMHIDVWVMKEFGVKESWVKSLTFPTLAIILWDPLCMLGDFVVLKGSHVAFYNLNNGTSNAIKFQDLLTTLGQMYVESLVSPNRV